MDQRAVFFAASAVLCALLVPLTPEAFRNVGVILAAVYTVLALASWLDDRSRRSRG
jgi:hypothetical protein